MISRFPCEVIWVTTWPLLTCSLVGLLDCWTVGLFGCSAVGQLDSWTVGLLVLSTHNKSTLLLICGLVVVARVLRWREIVVCFLSFFLRPGGKKRKNIKGDKCSRNKWRCGWTIIKREIMPSLVFFFFFCPFSPFRVCVFLCENARNATVHGSCACDFWA